VKVRLKNADFQMVNHCHYLCTLIKCMEPGSCHVACNRDISDYCTRIGLNQFIQHYSMKEHKELLLCQIIILENVLNNRHEL